MIDLSSDNDGKSDGRISFETPFKLDGHTKVTVPEDLWHRLKNAENWQKFLRKCQKEEKKKDGAG